MVLHCSLLMGTFSPTDTSNKFLSPNVTCRSTKLVATTASTTLTKTEIANSKPTELHTTRRMQKKGEWEEASFRGSFNNHCSFLFPAFHRPQTHGCRRQASKALQTLRQHTFSTGLHPLPHFPMASTMRSARRTFAFSKLCTNTKWVSPVPEAFQSTNASSFCSQLKEEALQRELHFMRLALLKNTSCQCNNSKDKQVASNHSDDMVRKTRDRLGRDVITQQVDFYSIRWSTATLRTPTAPGRPLTKEIRSFQYCGSPTMQLHAVRAVRLSSGWGEGNTIAGVAARFFVATAANILHPSPKRA